MNITILGRTGPAGLLTIQKALSLGHQVTAYARSPAKIIKHDHLTIVNGELDGACHIYNNAIFTSTFPIVQMPCYIFDVNNL